MNKYCITKMYYYSNSFVNYGSTHVISPVKLEDDN